MKFLRQRHQLRDVEQGGVPAPAGGAPEVAPVAAPAAVAPVVTPVVAPVAVTAPVTNVTYKDPAAKQVAGMLSDAGVDPVLARDAITANQGNVTPEIYAALSAKHGEGMASLLVGQMKQLHTDGVNAGNTADQAVYDQVAESFKGVTEQSGKETFAELKTWASTNIGDADRKELNAAIQQGGLVAKLAIQELTNMFQQSGDYGQEMIGIAGDNLPSAPAGGDLTAREYSAALDALSDKGHIYGESREMADLDRRRTRSAQRSI